MISITKETFEELDYLRRELELTGYNIKVLTAEIKRVEYELSKHVERVMDNSNSILFLSGTISVLLSEMERYLALHERVKSELDHILDALDNLSNSLLSHSVIRPSVLKRLIEHDRQQLAEKYSNYELVITEVHDYYNITVSSFDHMDGILGIFVPLFIRPSSQEPMYIYIYNVRTIPVPYHINTAMVDETENENAYTHIIPDTEMVAMNRDTYINVDQSELKQCIKFSVMYFCEQTFLMKHTSEHTCETAIYHEQNPDIIKDKCNIQYYPELNPTPQILDAGKHILLGNIPEPWSVVCSKNDPIPNPLKASKYVIIKKKDLCQCSLNAGTWFIQENIVHCEDEASSDLQLYYTVNMAVMIYLSSFSSQEYECLKGALGLVTVNRTLDLEKAMGMLQWFKQSTCPCNQHAVRRGGQVWQLRPSNAVPTDVVLQLPATSNSKILQRRKAVQEAKYSLLDDASSISSGETLLQDDPDEPKYVLPDLKDVYDKFNQKMKNPTIQELFPNDGLLTELCTIILKEVKQANPLKWVNHATSANTEVNELIYWKDQMKQDIDSIMSQIKTKLYTGLDEMFGEMQNLFQEEEDEVSQAAQAAQDVTTHDVTRMEEVD